VLGRHRGLPEGWQQIVEGRLAVWAELDAAERETLGAAADWLLRHKHWEAASGFALTDAVSVTIAAQAALLVLGLDVDEYREVSAVVVYPTAMRSRGVRSGPIAGTLSDGDVPVLGEAHGRRGPVLVAWDEAERSARAPGSGRNVVVHEFAHKLDMREGELDGTPRVGDREAARRWVEVCTEVFDALRAGVERPPLRPYGATNPAEFFAVATEAFFDVPAALRHHEPDLYEVLRDYYGQDPAERSRRADPRT
jgi:hypothetical protein